jgi:glyoxylase-like metal-dependent hydrolase (beta-lactamase superfamily II)
MVSGTDAPHRRFARTTGSSWWTHRRATNRRVQIEGWNVIDESAGIAWREYSFTRGARATTLAFRGSDGMVVVSPPPGLSPREYDALRELGDVRALIANNTFHHLGQAAWRARFPDAIGYCPPRAIATLEKKTRGLRFQPLDALALPSHVRCDDPPGMKSGETWISVGTAKGPVWFTGDVLTNIQRTPPPPVRWLFTATDSAPGFRLFKLGVWLFVADRSALREWALARVAADPPRVIVPAHGPAIEAVGLRELAKTQLERL